MTRAPSSPTSSVSAGGPRGTWVSGEPCGHLGEGGRCLGRGPLCLGECRHAGGPSVWGWGPWHVRGTQAFGGASCRGSPLVLGVASPVLWSLVWGYGVPSARTGSPAPPPPAGAQSPDQQELLAQHGPARPVFVEGPFPLWLRSTRLSYYVLRGDPLPPHLRVSPMDPGAWEGMGGDWTKSPVAWDEMKGEGAPMTLEGVGWATHGRRGLPLAQDRRGWDPHGPGEEGRGPLAQYG